MHASRFPRFRVLISAKRSEKACLCTVMESRRQAQPRRNVVKRVSVTKFSVIKIEKKRQIEKLSKKATFKKIDCYLVSKDNFVRSF